MLWRWESLLDWEAHGSPLSQKRWSGEKGKEDFLEEEKRAQISKMSRMQTEGMEQPS